ncbi:MAG: hypothetical protein DDT23_00687 [candidate division WS2 bacterium]|nr:hypothetical protein [Candidatus Lithacetigena glycinireducens]
MNKHYTLEEVRAIRDKISQLGERSFPLIEVRLEEVMAEWRKARTESNKITVEKAKAERKEAEAKWDAKLFTLLTQICPEAYHRDWKGYLAIPKDKKREWIIPLFTGDYTAGLNDVRHTAFSIWTIPKNSCDEDEAREVKDE